MTRHIWFNGRFFKENEAVLPVFDSAYLYGIGVFETMRGYDGGPQFFKEHFQRMKNNARRLGLVIPVSSAQLKKIIQQLMKKNGLREATVRLMLSRNDGWEPRTPSLAVTARPYVPQKGTKLIVAKSVLSDSVTIAGIKTTSYLTKMLARAEAQKRGAIEALLMNDQGKITEGASSNVFIIKKGKLITPPLAQGLLPGTRRRFIISVARSLKIRVIEKHLTLKDIYAADEVFISSTLKDVFPIQQVENKKIGKAFPGPITQALKKSYDKKVFGK